MRYLCKIYQNRPDHCAGYPWNEANDIFPDCQFVQNNVVVPLETIQSQKSQQEIEEYCIQCGKCCHFWDKGIPIHRCTGLIVEDQ